MITVIDYGLGNISAFANVYKRLDIPFTIARHASDLNTASKLILPGVGAFDHAMKRFDETGMREPVTRLVLEQDIPILGICVGMQILGLSSDEGNLAGLGWVDGRVKKLNGLSASNMPLPHMGWNNVNLVKQDPLFVGLETSSRYYFLHSYYFECTHQENILAESEYGCDFACAVRHKKIYGVQFHPEKSHHYGARLLKNFADL